MNQTGVSLDVVLGALYALSSIASLASAASLARRNIGNLWVPWHVTGMAAQPVIALVALCAGHSRTVFVGPWHLDDFTWTIAFFIGLIGWIVQRFAVRYMDGTRNYRRYFSWLTLMTVVISVTWFCDDTRCLLAFWGIALFALHRLIRLQDNWPAVQHLARSTAKSFFLCWFTMLIAFAMLAATTGRWPLHLALAPSSVTAIPVWSKWTIACLLVVSAWIPAGQWPFQRWLVESAVLPTPLSAVLHAGFVNAGGILLTLCAPLLNQSVNWVLFTFASITIAIGSGIFRVQVDYKRQLIGSTMAQMGFMLLQCALGAFGAALIHLILHGCFKATLFLRAGYAAPRKVRGRGRVQPSGRWNAAAPIVGLIASATYFVAAPSSPRHLLSAFLVAVAVTIAWRQLVMAAETVMQRVIGTMVALGIAAVALLVHKQLSFSIVASVSQGHEFGQGATTAISIAATICIAALVSFYTWLTQLKHVKWVWRIYLWFVNIGESSAHGYFHREMNKFGLDTGLKYSEGGHYIEYFNDGSNLPDDGKASTA